ncbi:MAG TPA: hypothetical protein VI320_24660 [Terracidiphilus sp.]
MSTEITAVIEARWQRHVQHLAHALPDGTKAIVCPDFACKLQIGGIVIGSTHCF